jgi:endonuclease III
MLSSQTKDEVTAKAMIQLQQLPLEIDKILEAKEEDLAQLIYPVSFYKVGCNKKKIFNQLFNLINCF